MLYGGVHAAHFGIALAGVEEGIRLSGELEIYIISIFFRRQTYLDFLRAGGETWP
jgi:hypothetical protein